MVAGSFGCALDIACAVGRRVPYGAGMPTTG